VDFVVCHRSLPVPGRPFPLEITRAWLEAFQKCLKEGLSVLTRQTGYQNGHTSPAIRELGDSEPRNNKMRISNDRPKQPIRMPEVGMILLDETFAVVASDYGAKAMLSAMCEPERLENPSMRLTGQILKGLDLHKRAAHTHWKVQIRIATSDYACLCYALEARNWPLAELPVFAIHLERVAEADEALNGVIASYHLTEREEQTLKGILTGLSTKEIADQMGISPNTVKAFTRLIMIKLGVTTRWGIIAKILGNREVHDESAQIAAGGGPP